MIKLDIKSELPTAVKWTNEHTKQLPFSISQALNSTVGGSRFLPGSQQSSIVKAMERTSQSAFNKPTVKELDDPKPEPEEGISAIEAISIELFIPHFLSDSLTMGCSI